MTMTARRCQTKLPAVPGLTCGWCGRPLTYQVVPETIRMPLPLQGAPCVRCVQLALCRAALIEHPGGVRPQPTTQEE